jgi:hypothetical protein
LSKGPSIFASSLVSQQSNQSLIDEVVISIPFSVDTSLILGGDVSLDHIISHPIQLVFEEVVTLMKSSTNPNLLLESEQSSKVVELTQYLVDPTLLSWSDASFDYVFIISLSSSPLPPSPRMVSFDWNDLVEPRLPSFAPFQITILVESMLKGICRCIVDEGSSASILSSSAWQDLGSPKLVSATSELLAFDKRPSE